MPSTPAETGGSHSGGPKAMPSTSIWKTITEDRFDDQEAPEARLAAHASRRTSSRGDFAGAGSVEDGNRQTARRVASDALRCPCGKAAGHPWHGVAAREAVRKWSGSLAQSAEAVRSAPRAAGARRDDQENSDVSSRLKEVA